ncbi:MAG: plasma membrane localization protein [Bathelium mastoideum]|nr:MAG: plasma membrane localization protein [Bathelium mastoideum]
MLSEAGQEQSRSEAQFQRAELFAVLCEHAEKQTTESRNFPGEADLERCFQRSYWILKALIEKCPRDLPLYAPFVLRILRNILRSGDIQSCEDTVGTFQAFCKHLDPATLIADQDYLNQYEDIVSIYAVFASKDTPVQMKGPTSVPIAVRYRETGLEALKAVVSSECLSAGTSKLLGLILPVVLENLHSKQASYLERLQEREQEKEKLEREQAFKRRQSTSTMRTAETDEADPIAASGTTADADKLAEEEVGCLALSVLRVIFNVVNRNQLRIGTSTALRFLTRKIESQSSTANGFRGLPESGWPVALFDIMCRSAPVQDHFVILVSTVETLIRSPIVESDMQKHLLLATIIGWLLSSDINFIGLSVMDVLIGFVQHILLILQLGGKDSALEPHSQQTDVIGSEGFPSTSQQRMASASAHNAPVVEVVKDPSQTRIQLLEQLRQCIADLATHIYYTDQISDMVSTILLRLKPSPRSSITNSTAAVENPAGAVEAIADSASISEKPNTDGFFTFDTARITAMLAVKDILLVANKRDSKGRLIAGSRSQVSFSVWEGTQWLLRDPNGLARRAYVDALLTWLKFEPTRNDLMVKEKKFSQNKGGKNGDSLAKRAVSNASREKGLKSVKSSFLSLLHLAVFENAHQYCDVELEMLLLHLLLASLVQKLGVNAAKSGLPMIWRLQEDIPSIENPICKIHIGSLVHGYLWALVEYFNIDASSVGSEIESEISRRRTAGLWATSIQIPPLTLDKTLGAPATSLRETLSQSTVRSASLKPFDHRERLVDRISEAYGISISSPPASPPGSPGRSSVSLAGLTSSYINAQTSLSDSPQLPSRVREQLLSNWTRESCIAATTSDSRSTSSLTGSKTGKSVGGARQQFLTMNGDNVDDVPPNAQPPYGQTFQQKTSNRGSPDMNTSSNSRTTPHVDDLKRFLASPVMIGGVGGAFPIVLRSSRSRRDADADDTASDSMVSAGEVSASEYSFGGTPTPTHRTSTQKDAMDGPSTRERDDLNANYEALMLSQRRATEYQDTIGNAPELSPSPQAMTFPSSVHSRPQTANTERTDGTDTDASPTPREATFAPTSPPRPSSALGQHHVTADEAPVPDPVSVESDVPPVPPLPRGLSTQNYKIPGAFPLTPGLETPTGAFGETANKQIGALETTSPPPKNGDYTVPPPRPTIKSPPPETQNSNAAKAKTAALAAAITTDPLKLPTQSSGPSHGHTRNASADAANTQEASDERAALTLLRGAQQQLARNDDTRLAITASRNSAGSARTGSPVRDHAGSYFQETGLGAERPVTPTSLRSGVGVGESEARVGGSSPSKGREGARAGLRPTTPTKSALKKVDGERSAKGTPSEARATRARSLSAGAKKKAVVQVDEDGKRQGEGKRAGYGSVGRKSGKVDGRDGAGDRELGRGRVDVRELLEGINGGGRKVSFEEGGLAASLGAGLGRERPVSRPPY